MAPAKCRGHPLQCGPDVVSVVRCADEVDVERRQHGVDQRLVDGLGAAIETEHAKARRGVAAAADPQLAVRGDGERAPRLTGEKSEQRGGGNTCVRTSSSRWLP